MDRHIVQTAVRPLRIAFVLGDHPSTNLVNRLVAICTGLWGGANNILCPTNGTAVSETFLRFVRQRRPDYGLLFGRFGDRKNVVRQLVGTGIDAENILKMNLDAAEELGVGIEGAFSSWYDQLSRSTWLPAVGLVDSRKGHPSLFDKFKYGVLPGRLSVYFGDRADMISISRLNTEVANAKSQFHAFANLIDLTTFGLDPVTQNMAAGWRPIISFLKRQAVVVVGDKRNLEDCCYYWNLRAMFGQDNVTLVPFEEMPDWGLDKWEKAGSRRLARIYFTGLEASHMRAIRARLPELAHPEARLLARDAVSMPLRNVITIQTPSTEQVFSQGGVMLVPSKAPRTFDLEYPKRPLWMIEVRLVRDDSISADGLVLPNSSRMEDLVKPEGYLGPAPRVHGSTLSVQAGVRQGPIKLKVPSDWDVIQHVFRAQGMEICPSDQGRYMRRAISFFGGLRELCAFLADSRWKLVFDTFRRHHKTGEMVQDKKYRRSMSLEQMLQAHSVAAESRSRKKRENSRRLFEETMKSLVVKGAMHSGFQLDCPTCNFDDWYPIDEVGETFRCKRCLSTESRPLSPTVFFRLNEALYQAYSNNFAVPALVLGLLEKTSRYGFNFSSQILTDKNNAHAPEIDIIAVVDGQIVVGEAKSNSQAERRQVSSLGEVALKVGAAKVIFATSSKDICGSNCRACTQREHYADQAFASGSESPESQWGPRERIANLRTDLSKSRIEVMTICGEDIRLRAAERE